ncbi:hypothetical protein B0H34DRAFT_705535 [Crassisporium funariophilum]|nr:hypothetical protein B0H34DRAFT_705535 [Crassisporium funariophilum]
MLLVTTATQVINSDEDEDGLDEEDIVQPPESSSRRKKKASEKVKSADKENLEKAEQALLKAKKRLENVKKAQGKQTQAKKHCNQVSSGSEEPDEPESEDEDEDNILFSSSTKPLRPMVIPQTQTPELRRIDLRKEIPTSQVSRRAFLNMPSATLSSAGLTPSHATATPFALDEDHSEPPSDLHNQPGPTSFLHNKRPRSLSSTDTETPPHLKKSKPQLLKVALRPGLVLTKPPTLTDFSDATVQALLLRAIREYEVLICSKGAFPSLAIRVQWAQTCWVNAQNDADKDEEKSAPRYDFTDRMLRLVKARGSRIRGDLLEPVRAQVMACYGFREGGKARDVRNNAKKAASLVEANSFHYKDPKTQTGYCQSPIIDCVLATTWFKDLTSPGIVFKHYFDPISLDTLALMFTLVRSCIDEWSTGKHIPTAFSEKAVLDNHKVFRADLDEWHTLNVAVTTNKRKKMFNRACKNAGVVDVNAAKPQLTGEAKERARKELEGHTGETDSEDEGEDGEDEDD